MLIVMPSLDIENGVVVKRVEGVRGTGLKVGEPRSVAEKLLEYGVEWVHVVDLDGAEAGKPVNLHVVKLLVDMGFRVQYGGGLRSIEAIETVLKIGAERVIVGTLLLRAPMIVARAVEEFGSDRVFAALDARSGVVLAEGWRRETSYTLLDALGLAGQVGVGGILYTSVEREGRLTGIDLDSVRVLRGRWGGVLEYAGGVSTIDDVIALAEEGVDAVVIGMAFHAGILEIPEALEAAARV